jgi:dimethylaniline monooxygenase (N-oxide forming)
MVAPRCVIIVGAGWYGLAAAKAYLQLRPDVDLTLIDADSSIGGVWSVARTHPYLIVDSPTALMEFSDLAMRDIESLHLNDWDMLPSDKVQEYMQAYARKHGINDRVRLNTTVKHITRLGESWQLEVVENESPMEMLVCDKLILATGVYSSPKLPNLDMSRFAGRTLHSKYFGEQLSNILSPSVSSVTVVGGCKSAIDSVLACASEGKEVNWVIREGGAGPAWLFAARRNGKPVARLKQTRASMVVSPNLYTRPSFLTWFFFTFSLGRKLLQRLMLKLSVGALVRYDNSANGNLIAPYTRKYVFNVE